MKRQKRKPYAAPTIQAVEVELEQGIAASSASLSGGETGDESTPLVEDWQDSGLDQDGYSTGDL